MSEIASAYVTLLPSASGFGSKMSSELGPEVNASGKRLGSGFGKVFALAGGVLAAAGIGGFLKDSIGEAREAQKVGALTENVIKSTGMAAKISASQVADLAGSLSAKTGVDDEAIQSGSNLLLTFKNIKREGTGLDDIFGRATAAAVDLSASGFGDINGASKQLGKALNDPIKGISALSKSGVTFTADQQALIKSLVEGGDTLSAQKIILKELESQVGGSAAASATAGEKASVAFGNLKETVGTALLPVIDRLATTFTDKIAPALTNTVGYLTNLGPKFSEIGDKATAAFEPARPVVEAVSKSIREGLGQAIPVAQGAFKAFLPVLKIFGDAMRQNITEALPQIKAVFNAVVESLRPVVSAIRANVVPLLQKFAGIFLNTVLPAMLALRSAVVAQVVPTIKLIGPVIAKIIPVVAQFAGYIVSKLVPVFSAIVKILTEQVIPILGEFARFVISTIVPAVGQIVAQVATKLKPVFDQLVATFQNTVLPALSSLLKTFKKYQPQIQQVILAVVKVAGFLIKLAAVILGKVLPPLIAFAGFIVKVLVARIKLFIRTVAFLVDGFAAVIRIAGRVSGAIGDFAGKVGTFFGKVKDVVAKTIGTVIDKVKALPGKIKDFVKDMVAAGAKFIGGLFTGIVNGAKNAGGFISSLVDSIKSAINSVLNLPLEINFDKGPIHIHATLIPAFAKGTNFAPGGIALVGEQGPELVDLPRGAAVRTASETRRLAQSPRLLGEVAGARTSGSGATGPLILRVGERDFVAYLSDVADSRVTSAAALANERRRASWSTSPR